MPKYIGPLTHIDHANKGRIFRRKSANGLISAWRAGNREAGAELCRRYAGHIRGAVCRQLGPALQARMGEEDLVQSIVMALLSRLRQGKIRFRNDASFGCWLRKFARHRTLKRIAFEFAQCRTPQREVRIVADPHHEQGVAEAANSMRRGRDTGHQESPLETIIAREFLARVRQRLPTSDRRIVELLVQGYPQIEIATLIGVTTRTVRRRMVHIGEAVRHETGR